MRIKIKALRKKSVRKSWPAAYRWAAMGTLVAYSAVGSKTFNVARAQDVKGGGAGNGPVAQTQGAQPVRRFEIAAGPLDSVLATFEQITGIKAAVSKEGIRNVASPGVTGLYTPEQALQKLLADTGVVYRFTAADAVSLELKTVATSVEVVTSVDALLTSTAKFTEPLRDTPQTVDVVSQKTMQEQGVTTLRDGLRNVAGISMAAGEGGSQGDNLTIRGFSARNDLYIDGMRDFGSYYRDPFNLEEIEVIQGPESTNFGRGSTGGVVNQATKFPNMNRMFSGTFDGGTDGTRRLTTDFNVPFQTLGTASAFRLNLMGNEGGVAGRPVANNKRYGIAPSLYFGLGTPDSHRDQRAQPAGR